MKLGIHLPHVGRKAGPDAIRRAAIQAEELGFADVWASEHIIVPQGAPYPPSPLFYDPILTLTWAAACTKRVGLGTSVLVLPMRHPLPLAKELATLQCLSEGRFILGAGVGWLKEEFEALGTSFAGRGKRMDESIALMRAAWTQDPVSFQAAHVPAVVERMRMLPMPPKIPVWVGGISKAAIQRAVRTGDGWHGTRLSPEDIAPVVRELRAARGADFPLSVRVGWDGKDTADLARRIEGYARAGMDHVMVEPWEREMDAWLRAVERVKAAAGQSVTMAA